MRRRRLVRRRFLMGCFIMLLFVTILTGRSMLTSMAEEEPMTASPYYRSVEIKEGDNLWNIARQYKKGSHMITEEYIKELKKMNSLRSDTIHKGQLLTVVYYR